VLLENSCKNSVRSLSVSAGTQSMGEMSPSTFRDARVPPPSFPSACANVYHTFSLGKRPQRIGHHALLRSRHIFARPEGKTHCCIIQRALARENPQLFSGRLWIENPHSMIHVYVNRQRICQKYQTLTTP